MKDIDFDELDRAVHSATNGGNSKSDDNTRSEPAPVDNESITPASSPVRPPVSLATRRSSGRFMDVVHPSSDMRTKVGGTNSSADDIHISVRKNVATNEPENVSTDSGEESWPDPIDFQEEHVNEKSEDKTADLADMSPLESPFLTDTKVEKRPLGAFSDDAPIESEESKDVLEEVSDIFEEEPSEELPEPIEKKDGVVEEDELLLLPESPDSEKEEPAVEVEQPIGPVSITQQYTEQPSTAEQSSTMIFDTDEYKKPLAHPKKKGSGWLIILWIIILLVVGAGAGAAIYFYVLPLL